MTAVEWLVEQVNTDCTNSVFIRPELIKEALEKEKSQMATLYNEVELRSAIKMARTLKNFREFQYHSHDIIESLKQNKQ